MNIVHKKLKVNSSQYSFIFGNNQVHFPYSIASLVSFARSDFNVDKNFHFEKVFLLRDDVEADAEKCRNANILLCSCYSWNWSITNILAKRVKEINPDCVVIFGGPEVPDISDGFFDSYPHVDFIVHGEGELILQEFLLEMISGKNFSKITGLESRNFKAIPRERITDLNIIPSPYTTGIMWDLVDREVGLNYVATWETNRGCPFSCTFCDWGSATKTKVRNFAQEKLFSEIEWFGENKIVYVDCADGNFGIFDKRDYELADKLCLTKSKHGFPTGINLTWVKSSSVKIIPIAKRLASEELLRAVTLSVQSMDANVLNIIKRKNIRFNDFEQLVEQFQNEGIQSYTELIMGLPGETVETYRNGWEILASVNPSPTIMTWNCSVFVNAPMNDEKYKTLHGIKTFMSPVFMSHTSATKKGIQEYEMMVNETNSLPGKSIHEVYLLNWMMLVFHSFGIFELFARMYARVLDVKFMDVYHEVENFVNSDNSMFSQEFDKARLVAEKGYSGGGWEHVDTDLGDICWPVEEASWLRLVRNKEKLFHELTHLAMFVKEHLDTDNVISTETIDDLVKFQLFYINTYEKDSTQTSKFSYDWVSFFKESREQLKKGVGPVRKNVSVSRVRPVTDSDIVQWGYKTVWFGRRNQKMKSKMQEMTYTEID